MIISIDKDNSFNFQSQEKPNVQREITKKKKKQRPTKQTAYCSNVKACQKTIADKNKTKKNL